MSYATVLTGPERRRKWPDELRRQILDEAFSADAVVADVARRYEVSTGLIYTWRRAALARGGSPGFVQARISDGRVAAEGAGLAIVVELEDGGRVSVSATAPAALVTAVLRALRK
jgi:transposase